jgi:hypothetical protein
MKIFNLEIDLEHDFRDRITQIELYDYSTNKLIQIIKDTSESYSFPDWVTYIDINLDGYLDIDIPLGYFNLVPFHSFWLYDNTRNLFFHSEEFSQLNDYYIDQEEKIISSHAQSTGGRGAEVEKYKIENGNLTLIETSYSNYYDYEKKALVNGDLITVELIEEDYSETNETDIEDAIILNYYKLLYDTLLLVEKEWLIDIDIKKEKNNVWSSDIYNCGPWGGCLKYLRREVYSYHLNQDGQLVKEILKYRVVNNKWEKLKN